MDQICLFDKDGVSCGGSSHKFYSDSRYSGEQISYFLTILDDKILEMCQNLTPNTAEDLRLFHGCDRGDRGPGADRS